MHMHCSYLNMFTDWFKTVVHAVTYETQTKTHQRNCGFSDILLSAPSLVEILHRSMSRQNWSSSSVWSSSAKWFFENPLRLAFLTLKNWLLLKFTELLEKFYLLLRKDLPVCQLSWQNCWVCTGLNQKYIQSLNKSVPIYIILANESYQWSMLKLELFFLEIDNTYL
jgi:hypothetical protein